MENELQMFNFNGQEVRTLTIDDEPYFVGKDVALILGYKDLSRALNQHVDREDRKALSYKASGDLYASLWAGKNDFSNKIVINESGLYSLIIASKLPQAKKFKRWVTSEVLPSKHKSNTLITNQKQNEEESKMNELQLFNFNGQDLAVKEIGGQVYFNAEQAAIGLGIVDTSKGYANVRWTRVNAFLGLSKGSQNSATSGGKIKRGDFITEPQFYKLAIKANNSVAEKFQDWVTSEVLPSIRKHGAYMTDQKAFDVVHNPNGLADLLQQAADQLKAKDIQIEEMKPKVEFADNIKASGTCISFIELSSFLSENGVKIGRNRLMKWAREKGFLIKSGVDYNTPTQRALDLKILEVDTRTRTDAYGNKVPYAVAMVTRKGEDYFLKSFLRAKEQAGFLEEF